MAEKRLQISPAFPVPSVEGHLAYKEKIATNSGLTYELYLLVFAFSKRVLYSMAQTGAHYVAPGHLELTAIFLP